MSHNKLNLTGQQFGRLKVIRESTFEQRVKKNKSYWVCLCNCGNLNEAIKAGRDLINGDTKSCGCLVSENAIANAKLATIKNSRYTPEIGDARTIWQRYRRYDDANLDFDTFYEFSQMNCHYCDCTPEYNFNNNLQRKTNKYFKYNGLDRIDSSLKHTLDNIVPACAICNKAKRDITRNQFYTMIRNICYRINDPIPNYKELSKNYSNEFCDPLVKGLMKNDAYYDNTMTPQQFNYMISLNCYYCGNYPKSRFYAKSKFCYLFNGLDRIENYDNNKIKTIHSIDNVVSCCKTCNWAKCTKSMVEFKTWALNVYNNLVNKKIIEPLENHPIVYNGNLLGTLMNTPQ